MFSTADAQPPQQEQDDQHHRRQQRQHMTTKDDQRDPPRCTPPPAYAPPVSSATTRLTADALRRVQAQQALPLRALSQNQHQQQPRLSVEHPLVARMQGTPAIYHPLHQCHEETPDSDEDEDRSPISLTINTAVSVSQSNNLVCLPGQSPSEQANAIARAVVAAIHENSAAKCGIPMIDEHGRPRPIKIEVDAGTRIYGSGNVVGGREFIEQVFRRQNDKRRARDGKEEAVAAAAAAPGGEREEGGEEEELPAKRRRSQA